MRILGDPDGVVVAEAGEGGEAVGEFGEGDFGVADGEAESVFRRGAGEGGEAEVGEEFVEGCGAAVLVEGAHGGDVEGVGEGVADGDGAE